MSRTWLKALALAGSLSLLAVACTEDDEGGTDDSTEETAADGSTDGTEAPAADVDLEALGLWDDGECDSSLDTLHVGLQTVFESGILTLEDQAQSLEAAAEAFNARGGANGHCIEVTTCDDRADPNAAVECPRTLDDAGVQVTVNDTTAVSGADVSAAYAAAGIPRFAISPNQDDYGDLNSYPFDGGGLGTSFMMPQALLDAGVTRVANVRVDLPAAGALIGILEATFADDGLEIVIDLPVPAGTTDYSQFILAAQDAGAEALIMPLGGQEGIQVIRAGQQLGADLLYSTSLGSLPYGDVAALGDYAENILLNAGNPPATFDDPIMDVITADLAATGVEALQRENLKTSPIRSWIGLYALLTIIRETGTEDFSRANLKAIIEASGPIDMLGLTDDWTPLTNNPGAFPRSGNGFYSFWGWDPEAEFEGNAGNFVQLGEGNLIEVLCGSPLGGPADTC